MMFGYDPNKPRGIWEVLARLDIWLLRRRLRWHYIRDAPRMLNRRVDVEGVLWEVARGRREPLTPADCRALAIYLGTHDAPWPHLETPVIERKRDAQQIRTPAPIDGSRSSESGSGQIDGHTPDGGP